MSCACVCANVCVCKCHSRDRKIFLVSKDKNTVLSLQFVCLLKFCVFVHPFDDNKNGKRIMETCIQVNRQAEGKEDRQIRRRCCFVGWLLIVPATCECISGMDLHRQFYVLPH